MDPGHGSPVVVQRPGGLASRVLPHQDVPGVGPGCEDVSLLAKRETGDGLQAAAAPTASRCRRRQDVVVVRLEVPDPDGGLTGGDGQHARASPSRLVVLGSGAHLKRHNFFDDGCFITLWLQQVNSSQDLGSLG